MNNVARIASYSEFHQALGHVSASYIRPSSYSDGYLIPPIPKAFHCHICNISNLTKKTPPPAHQRAKLPFELIHSDLSGKFSVRSLGKSLYYISFIDNKTHYPWVRFLREKSEAATTIRDFITFIEQ